MKKFLFALMIAVAALGAFPQPAYAAKHTTVVMTSDGKGNSHIDIKDDKVNPKDLKNYINKKLSDTVVDTKRAAATDENAKEAEPTHPGMNFSTDVDDNGVPVSVVAVVFIVFGTIIVIVVAALYFSYLHRRRKYQLIEKAIEQNYQLPEGVFNSVDMGSSKSRNADWGSLRSGVLFCAWGVAIMVFFLIEGEELAAVGLALLLIGVAKLYIAYKNNLLFAKKAEKQPLDEPKAPEEPTPADDPDQTTNSAE
jgi:hypothetical protein